MDDYLSKPVTMGQLEHMLERWLPAVESCVDMGLRLDACAAVEAPPLDAAVWEPLRHRATRDDAYLNKLVELFMDDSERRLQTLGEALANQRPNELARAAHALKAGCLQIGATRMAQVCDALDLAGRTASLEGADALLKRLREEFQRVQDALEGAKIDAG